MLNRYVYAKTKETHNTVHAFITKIDVAKSESQFELGRVAGGQNLWKLDVQLPKCQPFGAEPSAPKGFGRPSLKRTLTSCWKMLAHQWRSGTFSELDLQLPKGFALCHPLAQQGYG